MKLLVCNNELISSLLTQTVLGAMSKALATIITQPLIVAKVGLQSKPPASRQGRPFKSFVEVMQFVVQNEGLLGLFKGIAPQITKGLLVQGLLMMTKERFAPQISLETYLANLDTGWKCCSSFCSATYAKSGRNISRRLKSLRHPRSTISNQ